MTQALEYILATPPAKKPRKPRKTRPTKAEFAERLNELWMAWRQIDLGGTGDPYRTQRFGDFAEYAAERMCN